MEGAVLTSAKSKGKVACVAVPRDLHSRTIFNVWIDRSCVPKGSLPVRTASVYQIRLSVTNKIVVEIARMSCQLCVVSIFSSVFWCCCFPSPQTSLRLFLESYADSRSVQKFCSICYQSTVQHWQEILEFAINQVAWKRFRLITKRSFLVKLWNEKKMALGK